MIREFVPGDESCGELLSIERFAQQVSLQREVLADRPEAREEGLRALRVAKACHMPLSLPDGPTAVLHAVVRARRPS